MRGGAGYRQLFQLDGKATCKKEGLRRCRGETLVHEAEDVAVGTGKGADGHDAAVVGAVVAADPGRVTVA